jgi:hypothetical protein
VKAKASNVTDCIFVMSAVNPDSYTYIEVEHWPIRQTIPSQFWLRLVATSEYPSPCLYDDLLASARSQYLFPKTRIIIL